MTDVLSVGDAVLVAIKDQQHRIGNVRYIGISSDNEKYIGLNLIECIANGHDGTVNGVRRYSATPGHGYVVGVGGIVQKLSYTNLTNKLEQIITLCSKKFTEYLKAISERDEFIERLKKNIYSLKKELKEVKNQNEANKYHHSNENSDSSVLQHLSHLDPPSALAPDLSTESIPETVYDFTLVSPVPRKAGKFFADFKKDLDEKKLAKKDNKKSKKIHIEKHAEYSKWKRHLSKCSTLTKELSAISSISSASSDESDDDQEKQPKFRRGKGTGAPSTALTHGRSNSLNVESVSSGDPVVNRQRSRSHENIFNLIHAQQHQQELAIPINVNWPQSVLRKRSNSLDIDIGGQWQSFQPQPPHPLNNQYISKSNPSPISMNNVQQQSAPVYMNGSQSLHSSPLHTPLTQQQVVPRHGSPQLQRNSTPLTPHPSPLAPLQISPSIHRQVHASSTTNTPHGLPSANPSFGHQPRSMPETMFVYPVHQPQNRPNPEKNHMIRSVSAKLAEYAEYAQLQRMSNKLMNRSFQNKFPVPEVRNKTYYNSINNNNNNHNHRSLLNYNCNHHATNMQVLVQTNSAQ